MPNLGLTVIRGVWRGLSSRATAPKVQETGGSVRIAISITQRENQQLRPFLAKGQSGTELQNSHLDGSLLWWSLHVLFEVAFQPSESSTPLDFLLSDQSHVQDQEI
jgi:hypothetical protein